MVSRVGVASDDFRKQVLGYGLTRRKSCSDARSSLIAAAYVWQNYDLFPKFPGA